MLRLQAADERYDYSCVMLDLPEKYANQIKNWARQNIPKEWLAEGEKGYEDEIHVTVLYGIHTSDLNEVAPLLPDQSISIRLGPITRFSSKPTHDVLIIPVESDELFELNAEFVQNTKNTQDFPDYKPHVTLAYVKKGMGQNLEGVELFPGEDIKLSTVVWSPSEGEKRTLEIEESEESKTSWLWIPEFMRIYG